MRAPPVAVTQMNDVFALREMVKKISTAFAGFIAKHRGATNISADEERNEIEKMQSEKKAIETDIAKIREEEKALNDRYVVLRKEIEKEKDSGRDAERAVFTIMTRQNELRSTMATLATRAEKLDLEERDFKRLLGEGAVLVGREILDYKNFDIKGEAGSADGVIIEPRTDQEDRRRQIERLQIRLEDAGAGNSEEVMKEFNETSERDAFLIREITDLQKSALDLQNLIKELSERLNIEFKTGVTKINTQFTDFFKLMFGGGTAQLEVVKQEKKKNKPIDEDSMTEIAGTVADAVDDDSNLADEEGIDVHVALPNKKTKGLMMLSGGERALTSIALLFAISQVNPPPFIILDETDAALDEANSRKYGDMIANLAKFSQLILITHNRETMSRAGVLYGITMASGGNSKLLSIQFDEALQVAK